MADEKGTGQHAHKSSEEPYPHHEAPTTRGESGSSRSSSGSSSSHSSSSSSGREESGSGSSSNDSDLKSREYRDNEGNVHHHTRTSDAMKEGGSEDRDKER
jgi:hypothetical protein